MACPIRPLLIENVFLVKDSPSASVGGQKIIIIHYCDDPSCGRHAAVTAH